MLKVGLTGGLATGKSFVGQALADLGCHLVQADQIGREALLKGGEAYEGVLREFGTGILSNGGEIDRRRLAAEVFRSQERLTVLNRVVHPIVFRREAEFLEQAARQDPRGIAVIEAAILIEAGSYKRFDKLIVAACDEEQQVLRAMARDGSTREEVSARLRSQMPVSEKRKYADYVIDTSGAKTETLAQVREVWKKLRSIET